MLYFLSDMLSVIHLTLVHSEWCHYKNNDLKFMAKYPHFKHLTFPFPQVLECTSQNWFTVDGALWLDSSTYFSSVQFSSVHFDLITLHLQYRGGFHAGTGPISVGWWWHHHWIGRFISNIVIYSWVLYNKFSYKIDWQTFVMKACFTSYVVSTGMVNWKACIPEIKNL